MSSELRDLYQELILDHQRRPRNYGRLDPADRQARGVNPLCGDQLSLYLRLEGDRIADLSFEGTGCAISKASASMMTERLKGRSLAEAQQIFERFHALVTGEAPAEDAEESLGKLAVFAGVREFPARVKCATLCWHTLRSALESDGRTVSTE
jgi:nitrogen fixation NifU-like protein